MLARGAHPLRPIITVARANNPAVQHLFRRAFAGYVATRAHAGTIKKLEAEIKRVNADFSLSANFKYRNSVRLFAMIDHAKSCMEVRALHAKVAPFSFDGILQAKPAEQKACYLADAKEAFQKGRAVSQEIERLQWVVFKLMVFAPRGDVPIKESLIRVPLFARQVFDSAVKRIANRMAMKLLA